MQKIKHVAIYDLDGTVVCSKHRYRVKDGKIDLPHWKANAHKCTEDKLLPLAKRYKRDLKSGKKFVILATARKLGKLDYEFIKQKLGMPDAIVSRENDKQDTQQLKIEGIEKAIDGLSGVKITIFEDNIKNLTTLTNHFNGIGVYVPSDQGH